VNRQWGLTDTKQMFTQQGDVRPKLRRPADGEVAGIIGECGVQR